MNLKKNQPKRVPHRILQIETISVSLRTTNATSTLKDIQKNKLKCSRYIFPSRRSEGAVGVWYFRESRDRGGVRRGILAVVATEPSAQKAVQRRGRACMISYRVRL